MSRALWFVHTLMLHLLSAKKRTMSRLHQQQWRSPTDLKADRWFINPPVLLCKNQCPIALPQNTCEFSFLNFKAKLVRVRQIQCRGTDREQSLIFTAQCWYQFAPSERIFHVLFHLYYRANNSPWHNVIMVRINNQLENDCSGGNMQEDRMDCTHVLEEEFDIFCFIDKKLRIVKYHGKTIYFIKPYWPRSFIL